MSFGVTGETANALGQSYDFRVMAFGEGAAGDTAAVAAAANRMLREGLPDPNDVQRIVDAGDRPLPPLFAELLRHHGVDAVAAHALSFLTRGRGLGVLRDASSGDPIQIANIRLGFRDMTWVSLGDGRSSWRATEMLLPAIPETARASLLGGPLRRLVSHPVLDGMDLSITAFHDPWEDETMMEVVTSIHPYDPD